MNLIMKSHHLGFTAKADTPIRSLAFAEALRTLMRFDEKLNAWLGPLTVIWAVEQTCINHGVGRKFCPQLLKQVMITQREGVSITTLTPLDFQPAGAKMLALNKTYMLSDEQGLGKTIQAIMALADLGHPPVMICAPSSVKLNWRDELTLHLSDKYIITVIKNRAQFRYPTDNEIVIFNKEQLPQRTQQCTLANIRLIVDEAHELSGDADALGVAPNGTRLRIPRTQCVNRMASLIAALRKKNGWVWFFTATPLGNDPSRLRNLLRLLGVFDMLFENDEEYEYMFRARHERLEIKDKRTNVIRRVIKTHWGTPREELAPILKRVIFRREKCDVLASLPSKRLQKVSIELCTDVSSLHNQAVRVIAERNRDLLDWRHWVSLSETPRFEEVSRALNALASAKVKALLEWAKLYEDAGEAVIVMSAHRVCVEVFAGREGWGVIHGGIPRAKRQDIVNALRNKRLKGVACTIRAAGVGLTLTAAAHMLVPSVDWNPALNAQMIDRIHRYTQTRKVLIRFLTSNTKLEELQWKVLEHKLLSNQITSMLAVR